MNRTFTEQKVLKKLGISDFRHMTKDKVVSFASMLHRMDPEVAKKVIEQFPKYTELASEMVSVYKAVALEILEKNATSMRPFYEACTSIIASLQKQLEGNDIEADTRNVINNQMIEVARMIGEKDTQNKHFLSAMAGWVVKGLLGLAGIAALILGVSKSKSKDDFDV